MFSVSLCSSISTPHPPPLFSGVTYILEPNNPGWNRLVLNDLYTTGRSLYSRLLRFLALRVCLSAAPASPRRFRLGGLVENDALRLELGKARSRPDLYPGDAFADYLTILSLFVSLTLSRVV